jgi:hypothetical protein
MAYVGETVGDDGIVDVFEGGIVDVGFGVLDGATVLVGVNVWLGVNGMVGNASTVFVEGSLPILAPGVK